MTEATQYLLCVLHEHWSGHTPENVASLTSHWFDKPDLWITLRFPTAAEATWKVSVIVHWLHFSRRFGAAGAMARALEFENP